MVDQAAKESLFPTKRRRIWFGILVAGFALLCLGFALLQILAPGKTALEAWLAKHREKGEIYTIDELFPNGFGDVNTNRIAEVERLLMMLDPRPMEMAGQVMVTETNGTAIPAWQVVDPFVLMDPKATNSPTAWALLESAIDGAKPEIDQLLKLLHTPDRDYGDALRTGSAVRPDFVKKRNLIQQLVATLMIELQRGETDRAREIYHAALRWPEWHADHGTLVNHMIRVAMSRLLVDAQWSMLARPGWTDADLLHWQTHWSTNVLAQDFLRTLRVERAMVFEMFDRARDGGASGLARMGGKSKFHAKLWGGIWRAGMDDADQLFYARTMQGFIDANVKGYQERNYLPVQRDVGRICLEVDRKLASFVGSFYVMTGITVPALDRANATVFGYEADRELAVVALALERFHRKHGFYPNKLEEMTPEFLAQLPVDWMNGKVPIYERRPDEQFHLRSVGPNGMDNGGSGDDILWYRYTDRTNGVAGPSHTP